MFMFKLFGSRDILGAGYDNLQNKTILEVRLTALSLLGAFEQKQINTKKNTRNIAEGVFWDAKRSIFSCLVRFLNTMLFPFFC